MFDMNYWSIAPGELESLMFRRSTGTASFDGIPANFSFEVREHSSAQNEPGTMLHNTDNDHAAMKQQLRGQQPQQQTANGNMGAQQATAMYHQQPQHHGSQQPQQQQQQQQQMKDMKSEQAGGAQQVAVSGAHNVQVKHMQQLNNDILLFPVSNSQPNNANFGAGSVAGVLLTAVPTTATISNVSHAPAANSTPAPLVPTDGAKPKKKKQKKAATGSMPPTMVGSRPPAPRAQCLLCERNYGNRRDLRRHVLAHHEGVRYMCRLCSKVMMSSKSVRAHLKSSAHRLLNDDEIAMNIEKMTPTAKPPVAMNAFNAIGASTSSGSMPSAMNVKKET